jgi:hypothetical protein
LGIQGLFLVVSVVGRCLFDLAEEVLLDVELADVRDCTALDGVVGEEFGAVVNDGWIWLGMSGRNGEVGMLTVEVVGTANIVARNHGDEGSGAVGGGGCKPAKGVAGERGAVAIAFGLDASVDTGGVAAPELDVGICDGLTAWSVDNIDVEMGDGTLLTAEQVLSNKLASNP